MIDPAAFARLLCGYCLDVRPGRQVLLRSTTLAAPLLLALQREVLEREAWPLLRTAVPGQDEGFYASARDLQIDTVSAAARAETEAADCFLSVDAPENTRALADVDPEKLTRTRRASSELSEIRLARRWCRSIWPTPALAQEAGLGLAAYTGFLERALFLDRPDPVAAWEELSAGQAKLIERLAPAEEIRIEAEGTDLRLRVGGRTWMNSDGKRNMPSGEVFTGPHEDGVEGRVRFTVPTGPPGIAVEGVELELRGGEVVSARADRGADHLERALATDAGARRLGELGIGTNFGIDRATGNILLDEKMGGTVHLALGRSYRETGGVNASALHWDLICDLRAGGRLTADAVPIVEDGRLAGAT
ncbi:MAG TPA: aminopeptidase [Solirubrobacteraceae bacterium]